MAQSGTDLTPIQVRAVKALLENRNTMRAAKAVGVGRRTLYRWLEDPAFRQALTDAKVRLMERTETSLMAGLWIALTQLEYLMAKGENDGVRLRACVEWADLVLKYRDENDLYRRIERLEEGYAKQEQQGQANR